MFKTTNSNIRSFVGNRQSIKNITNQPEEKATNTAHLHAGVEQAMAALAHLVDGLQVLSADARVVRFTGHERGTGLAVQLVALQPGLASDLRQRELFYLEAFAAAKLTHFNIARTGRPQESNGIHFYVIEHKREAHTLHDELNRNGWLAVNIACDIADQIASALDCAHALGVLHLQLS